MSKAELTLSKEEKDIFQEMMNISFGQASADLASLLDTRISLSIPYVEILKKKEINLYLQKKLKSLNDICVVQQNFNGNFSGLCFLIFPSGSGKKLNLILDQVPTDSLESDELNQNEKYAILEVSNILIGACVSKLSQLLNDSTVYARPVLNTFAQLDVGSLLKTVSTDQVIVLLQTSFMIKNENLNGFLYIITKESSLIWFKKALSNFLKQYE